MIVVNYSIIELVLFYNLMRKNTLIRESTI